MRPYEKTHAFLDFSLNVNRFAPNLWIKLGEASSKWDHIAGTPLEPAEAGRLHRLYLAKGAAATTAIEGNTLSEEEVIDLLDGKTSLPRSQEYLKQEVQNIIDAFELMIEKLGRTGCGGHITVDLIKELNTVVLRDLPNDEDVVPGQTRKVNVGVSRYQCPPWEDCDFLLDSLCERLNSFPQIDRDPKVNAIIKAIYAHINFVWVHPFRDGNGRTARLIEAFILLSANCPTPVAHLLSNYFNRTRSLYYQKLDEARLGGAGPVPFIEYAVTGLVEGLREQIKVIRNYQWNVSWINHVHNYFKDMDGAVPKRRRALVLCVPDTGIPATNKLKNVPAEVRLLYNDKADITFVRDVQSLIEDKLLVERDERYYPARENILAFLPWRADISETVAGAA